MISETRLAENSSLAGVDATQPHRRRGWYRLAVFLAVVIGLAFAHAWILQGLGRILVVDQEADDPRYICLFEPAGHFRRVDGPYDRAARLCRDDPSRQILLIEPERMMRPVREGAIPSFETISRQQLGARGVDPGAIDALDTPRNAWEATRRLRTWLRARPDGQVLATCDRFRSRYYRFLLDSVLTPEEAQRVQLVALPDHRFDETNWWKSRLGFKEFFNGAVVVLYAWCHGEDTLEPPPWDPDQYEAALRTDRGNFP